MNQWRSDFPMLKQRVHGLPLVYLDSAATAHKPQCVIDTMKQFYEEQYGTVHRAVYHLAAASTDLYHESRLTARVFLNAKAAEEIIFTRGTTESINLIAYSFTRAFMSEGDEVVISELEHHANIVSWQLVCQERGLKLRVIPATDSGELDLQAYGELLSPRTKMVSIGHIANSIGTLHPIKKVIDMAHDVGAKVLIDGAQAAPSIPVDVRALDCDFYVFSGHKTYGPTGIGVLYGKKELLDAMPPYQGGGDMIDQVQFDGTTYAEVPLKFEAGTPMIAEVIGLGRALQYMMDIGMDKIAQWKHALLVDATEKISTIPEVEILGTSPMKGGILAFNIKGAHSLDVGTLLDLKGICVRTGHHCAQPTMARYGIQSSLRASFGLYNNEEDVNTFIRALSSVVQLMA